MKTIVFNLFNGFNIRYLVHSGIIESLRILNYRVIITSYNSKEIKKNFSNKKNIEFHQLNEKIDNNFKNKRIYFFLNLIRYHMHGGKFKTPNLHFEIFKKDLLKNKTVKNTILVFVLKLLLKTLNNFKILRLIFLQITENLYPSYYEKFYEKFRPDLVICNSLGTFSNDDFLLRSAKKNSVKSLSIILSWDNSTTRGYPGCSPSRVIAWTKIMKNELIKLSDIKEEKIFVLGTAQFDHYFKKQKKSKKYFLKKFKLKKKNIIFFATRGPNTYTSNAEIIETICKVIISNKLKDTELLTRIHPLHYLKDKSKKYKILFKNYKYLERKYKNILKINYPKITNDKTNFHFSSSENDDLYLILKYSNMVINIFSTFNIEGSIFDKPLINVCFQKSKPNLEKKFKSRYDVIIDLNQDHNQRLIKTGGVKNCKNEEELSISIMEALKKPKKFSQNRKKIFKNEIGPNQGNASSAISKNIQQFVNYSLKH